MRQLCVLIVVAALAPAALAVTTRTWHITSYKDFEEGEANGVLLSSLGEASSGFGATRLDVPESVVYSSVTAPDGSIYLGTGDQGMVYRYARGKVKQLARLDAVLVTALSVGPRGAIFAGTMPGGRVFAIEDGRARELAKLNAEHVWALAFDPDRQVLYASTGPEGKLFAIDVAIPPASGPAKKSATPTATRLVYDSGEKHLLSLVRSDDGTLYAGSADQAILYRIAIDKNGAARVRAIHDFDGEEVRAIAQHGATLYVAVNEFQKGSGAPAPGATTVPKGTKIVLPPSPPVTGVTPAVPSTRDRKGKGAVYRVDPDGRVEQLHALADGYFTALHVDAEGNLYAASGANGRVYLIKPDRTVITAVDLPERQVLTLALGGKDRLLGTGDAGAAYRIDSSPPKDARYLTKVFDAQFPARWGNLRWSGDGKLTVETRSGNTSRPDRTWSNWQAPEKVWRAASSSVGRIPSPEGRYLQVRVGFGGSHTVLRDVTVYYLPQNQRARVTEVIVGEDPGARKVSTSTRANRPRSPVVKLRWKVDNPDDDELIYRLYFREENEVNWKPIGGPEPLTRTEFDWNTESIPDGNYLVKVVASDERANPREEALEQVLVSTPFLIDNRKPELADIRVDYPVASGVARDSFSPISELAYSVDGGDWQPFSPRDGIFDDPVEEFRVILPPGLQPGTHSLAVRAVDAADNVGAAQISFRVGEPPSPRRR